MRFNRSSRKSNIICGIRIFKQMLHTQVENTSTLAPFPTHWSSLTDAVVHQARNQPNALAITDSTGIRLTYRQLLTMAIALANNLKSSLSSCKCVGIMLPPSAAAAAANIAIMLIGKIPVNLNYSFSQKLFDASIDECNIDHVISSRHMLKRINIVPKAFVIELENVRNEVTCLEKITARLESDFVPECFLEEFFPGLSHHSRIDFSTITNELVVDGEKNRIDQPATIIFTAGSTGIPKAVVLSHANILSNSHAIRLRGQVLPGETILGVIPFFHAFGLTMTLWAPLCLGESVIYHYDPLDARCIGKLCQKFKPTAFICTPTMMTSYLRRCASEQFASIRSLILGGEKVKPQQMKDIQSRLGDTFLEGYGLAETSPVIACNVAGMVTLEDGREVCGRRVGTVGLPLPGTTLRVTDRETGVEVARGVEGMISVRGPQVMLGYLHHLKETDKVLNKGWFHTGDIGFIDEDGFLTITGRMSQFSKIAGEMVPHLAVEECIVRATGGAPLDLSVTSVPDEKRGERLIVVCANLPISPPRVVKRLRATDISRLWIPDPSDFVLVQELPVLRNGKLDLQAIRKIALDHACR
ncbi:MAG: AMP-binding protein, partial [Terriglobales bacterium]